MEFSAKSVEPHQSASHRQLVLDTAHWVALDILASCAGKEALTHIAEAARVLAGARYVALGVIRWARRATRVG